MSKQIEFCGTILNVQSKAAHNILKEVSNKKWFSHRDSSEELTPKYLTKLGLKPYLGCFKSVMKVMIFKTGGNVFILFNDLCEKAKCYQSSLYTVKQNKNVHL